MRCAPIVGLSGSLVPAASGVAGIWQTARMIRAAIERAKVDPMMIEAATALIYMTPAKDTDAEASAIFEWVRDHVRYVRDPAGVESLASPQTTYRRQAGDCDDQVALLGALLEAVGYPVRLIIAAYDAPGQWSHVYLQVMTDGGWRDADPTENLPLGVAPDGALSVWTESR